MHAAVRNRDRGRRVGVYNAAGRYYLPLRYYASCVRYANDADKLRNAVLIAAIVVIIIIIVVPSKRLRAAELIHRD